MKLKLFSFFAGSGFLDLGFELNGYSIELVNEFSESFMNAYKYSRQQMGLPAPKYGYSNIDIYKYLDNRSEELRKYIVDARKNNGLVGFIGGPPSTHSRNSLFRRAGPVCQQQCCNTAR